MERGPFFTVRRVFNGTGWGIIGGKLYFCIKLPGPCPGARPELSPMKPIRKPSTLVLCLAWLCVAAGPWSSAAADFPLVTYGLADGLSSNTVRSVTQDGDGFLWIGTADGLNRFDGRTFKAFSSRNREYHRLENTSVHTVCCGSSDVLWVGTDEGLYVFDKREEMFNRFDMETVYGVSIIARVTSVLENTDGKVWIATAGQGYFIYDPTAGTLTQSSLLSGFAGPMVQGPDGRVAVGSRLGSVAEYDRDGKLIESVPLEWMAPGHINAELRALCYYGGRLWCGLEAVGLVRVIPADEFIGVPTVSHVSPYPVKSILPLGDGKLLIGSDNGLYLYDIDSGTTTEATSGIDAVQGVDRFANVLFCDMEGGIWIGTEYAGLSYIKRNRKPVAAYFSPGADARGRIVGSFAEDGAGRIWVGTEDDGILCIEDGRQVVRPALKGWDEGPGRIRSVRSLLYHEDTLWIGTPKNGLYGYDTATGLIRNYRYDKNNNNTPNDDCVDALYVSRDGCLYAGTPWGFSYYDPEQDIFVRVMKGGNNLGVCGFADNDRDSFWIVSPNRAAFLYYPLDDELRHFPFPANSRAVVNCILKDGENIFVGTEAGVFTPDLTAGRLRRYDNVPATFNVLSMLTDNKGNLWMATNGGICSYRPDGSLYLRLNASNGLPSEVMNKRAALGIDGRLFFGTINGAAAFYPDSLEVNGYRPVSVVSDVYVNDKPLAVSRDKRTGPQLGGAAYLTGSLTLPYNYNSFAVSISSSSFQTPAMNGFAYLLKGSGRDWTVTDDNYVRFEKLQPGRYTLTVRSSNDDWRWGAGSPPLQIRILPPFYRSWIAVVIYIAVGAVAIWTVYALVRARNRKKMRAFLLRQEKLNYRSKMDFFTNVAHEIRTPLTLIKTPLDYILSSGEEFSSRTMDYLGVMQRNATNLLDMTNQLMDLQKNDGGDYRPVITRVDVSQAVESVCVRFEPVLEIQGVRLEKKIAPGVTANADADAVGKIVTNLLSNASKYASSVIRVSLLAEEGKFILTVTDDGPGIKPGNEQKIFTSFYRSEGSKAGSGIGLSLVKLLVTKHEGIIRCRNTESGGACFEAVVPCNLEPGKGEAEPQPAAGPSETVPSAAGPKQPLPGDQAGYTPAGTAPTVLIVEDNPELLDIMTHILGTKYRTLIARDGNAAVGVLEDHGADIVVTDIMMPGMDGYQLCEFIKSDLSYCHIPVVQVTAKNMLQDKIKGIGLGADAYIEKPFSPEHLTVQVDTLLANRERIVRSLMRSRKDGDLPPAGLSGRDREFLERLDGELEKNLARDNFSVEDLAAGMYMSRSNFYRKIKGLTGLAPNDYLKKYRLARAAGFLRSGDYQVTEIYELVGFRSAAYFSVCFKNEYGITPKQYKTRHTSAPMQVDFDNK